ncbi:unnamed protein product, partial [Candidula unifasciata]
VLVTHYVMPKLTERGCLIVGGIAVSLLTMGAAFAPNIGVFIVILSVKGIVNGLNYVPAMALIPRYFKRYRSRASVIPFCGGSAANIIAPFVIRAVREEYGIRGCYILLSAVELHYCVAGLLLRPVSAYRFRPEDPKTVGNDTTALQSQVPANSQDLLLNDAAKENHDKLLQVKSKELDRDVGATEALLNHVHEALHQKTVINTDEMADGTLTADSSKDSNPDGQTQSNKEHRKEDVADKPAVKSQTRWHKFCQASGLELWGFRCMLVSTIPGSVSSYLLNYMPTICKFQGASFEQAAFLTTIMGGVELVSRISTGFFADTKVLPPSSLFVMIQLCLGIGCHFFRFTTSFVTLIPMVVYTAIFLGSRAPLQSLMCQEVVGPKKFPQAYSLAIVILTLSSSILNPALGALVEATGSFVLVTHILGTCFLIGSGMLACLPLFVRLDAKHGRNK